MNIKVSQFFILILLSFMIVGCAPSEEEVATMTAAVWTATPIPTNTPLPTPTSPPSILTGQITEEDGAIEGRKVFFCKYIGSLETIPFECEVGDEYYVTNENGVFEVQELEPGNYLIIYDSGYPNFEEAFENIKGEIFKVGNYNWLIENNIIHEGEDGSININLYRGMSLMSESAFYLAILHIGNPPFHIAFDTEAEDIYIHFEVVEGTSNEIEFAAYFSDIE